MLDDDLLVAEQFVRGVGPGGGVAPEIPHAHGLSDQEGKGVAVMVGDKLVQQFTESFVRGVFVHASETTPSRDRCAAERDDAPAAAGGAPLRTSETRTYIRTCSGLRCALRVCCDCLAMSCRTKPRPAVPALPRLGAPYRRLAVGSREVVFSP